MKFIKCVALLVIFYSFSCFSLTPDMLNLLTAVAVNGFGFMVLAIFIGWIYARPGETIGACLKRNFTLTKRISSNLNGNNHQR